MKVGDKAPNFTLPAINGESVTLSDSLKSGENILLIFLRHLG